MSSTINFFLDKSRYIFNFEAVDNDISTDFFCKGKFVIVDINRDYMSIEYFFSVLNREITNSTSTIKNNPLAWFNFGLFNGFIGCYTSTCDRRGLGWIKSVRNFNSIVCCYDTFLLYGKGFHGQLYSIRKCHILQRTKQR